MDKILDELEKSIDRSKSLNVDIIKIVITMNPVEWKSNIFLNEKATELLKKTKGISHDDLKRILDKHLEKPLDEMMEELTVISAEFLMKSIFEELVNKNEWS